MTRAHDERRACAVCGGTFPRSQWVAGGALRDAISEEIRRSVPAWTEDDVICRKDLAAARASYVRHLLSHQWERLASIQELQMELLNEIGRARP